MKNVDHLPVATEEECQNHRKELIEAKIIKPGFIKTKRIQLIEAGIIDQNLCALPKTKPLKLEEGEYSVKPITNENYYVRKQAYFRSLQEILVSRINLKLIYND